MSRIVLLALLSVAAAAFAGEPNPREAAINLTPGAPPPSPALVATLAEKDRQLFDAVFGCKPELLEMLVAEDFEFFHDKHGLTTQSGAQFVKDITGMCERQAAGTDFRARRELVPGSMTVHIIGDYGAMQMGTHRFFALQAGKPDRLTETGKFIDLWKREGETWKLARVISYDHQLAE
jgi:hypothetical protein